MELSYSQTLQSLISIEEQIKQDKDKLMKLEKSMLEDEMALDILQEEIQQNEYNIVGEKDKNLQLEEVVDTNAAHIRNLETGFEKIKRIQNALRQEKITKSLSEKCKKFVDASEMKYQVEMNVIKVRGKTSLSCPINF